jgi:ABC-type taurine transport system ATPase subunit
MAEGDHKMVNGLNGLIEIKKLRKTFPREGANIVVLDDVDLSFEGGEFIVLIGPSGCGKSTLLRLIAGLIRQDSGTISLDGVEITKPGCERGLVFQDPTLFAWMNIYENIAYGLRSRGVYKNEKHRFPDFFRMVGL